MMENHAKLFCVAQYMVELCNHGKCTIPFEHEEIYYVIAESLLQMYIDYEVDRGATFIVITVKK